MSWGTWAIVNAALCLATYLCVGIWQRYARRRKYKPEFDPRGDPIEGIEERMAREALVRQVRDAEIREGHRPMWYWFRNLPSLFKSPGGLAMPGVMRSDADGVPDILQDLAYEPWDRTFRALLASGDVLPVTHEQVDSSLDRMGYDSFLAEAATILIWDTVAGIAEGYYADYREHLADEQLSVVETVQQFEGATPPPRRNMRSRLRRSR